MTFWESLPKPFFVQAPLEDVTDVAFRQMFALNGKPDVTWTEFTSADGLVLAPEKGQHKLRKKLAFFPNERPIVAQLFSGIPERMEKAAHIVAELGFDGIDINMGCPDRAVEKGGAGAALIKDPPRARALIRAAQSAGLPVSVKTRVGYNKVELETWIPEILAEKPAALTIHARTRKEMSEVPARWEHVRQVVGLRNSLSPQTRIIGNGDVKSIAEANARVEETGCDGVMIGRGLFGNPWFFTEHIPTPQEKIRALIEHISLFEQHLSSVSNYATMKKHFKAYISGFDGAAELRAELMETQYTLDAVTLLKKYLLYYTN
jgi:nifR3 family TIM-barrel protein